MPQGEDFVRTSGVPFAVVRPVALTEEPAGAELLLDQGDTIKVHFHVQNQGYPPAQKNQPNYEVLCYCPMASTL